MPAPRDLQPYPPPYQRGAIVRASHKACLETLSHDAVTAALWQRQGQLPRGLDKVLAWLEHAAPLPSLRESGTPQQLQVLLRQRLGSVLAPAPQQGAPLINDMLQLLSLFQRVTGAGAFEARIDSGALAPAPRFHADATALRLICTYRGPGTEYLPSREVDWQAFYDRIMGDWAIAQHANAVQQMDALDVMVMRGLSADAGEPDMETGGPLPLIHRSPAAQGGRSEQRLALILTPR